MNKTELEKYRKEYACVKVIHDNLIPGIYREIVLRAQNDAKFERMIQAMTTDKIMGGGSLTKYIYKER